MVKFSEDKLKEVQSMIDRYPEGKQKSALIPLLHLAQEEFGGWLSAETMDYVGTLLGIEPIEVYEVATFYSMYNLQPVGKHVFEVCHTGPCMLKGSDDIIGYIKSTLGIKVGETTADGMFTLAHAECQAACTEAPTLQVNYRYRFHVTPTDFDNLVDDLRAGKLADEIPAHGVLAKVRQRIPADKGVGAVAPEDVTEGPAWLDGKPAL